MNGSTLQWVCLGLCWSFFSSNDPPTLAQEQVLGTMHRLDSPLLPNAIWVHPSVMSGGMPDGKPALEELARIGIKTVISVDGIKPDAEGAEAAGLRYVHLPHGYDGISEKRLLEISKAIQELPGPVYIHCHHGKHRSPAAAAAACIALGKIAPSQGPELLRMAGTNPGFRGLVRCVERATRLSPDRLAEVSVDFVSISEVPRLVETMVAIDAIFDRLKEHQQRSGANAPTDPTSDALLLKEHYMELHRTESERNAEQEYLALLDRGRRLAEQLEARLHLHRSENSTEGRILADGLIQQISDNCSSCHSQYRDNR